MFAECLTDLKCFRFVATITNIIVIFSASTWCCNLYLVLFQYLKGSLELESRAGPL